MNTSPDFPAHPVPTPADAPAGAVPVSNPWLGPNAPAVPGTESPLESEPRHDKKKKKKNKHLLPMASGGEGVAPEEARPKLGSSRGIETMFRTSYSQHVDLSSLADNKANIMISINGIIISIVIASISPKIDANPWLLLPTSVVLVTCVISLIYAILAARPRVSSQVFTLDDIRNNRANLLFFGNFVRMPQEQYIESMTELLLNVDRLYYHMMRDLYSLGKVLARKFALLRYSYTFFMYGITVGIGLFIMVYLWVVFSTGAAASTTEPFIPPVQP
jgi:hypothetical protein